VRKIDSMFTKATSFKHELCGPAWVHSMASRDDIFAGSHGRIARTVCHDDSPQRWLARWQVASTTPAVAAANKVCSKCGKFTKSGRVSCCAPGGAWYKNCGGAGNKKFDYNWIEGVEACKSTAATTTVASACLTCGLIKKTGKLSCCARGGSWFGDCAATANADVQHTWYEGVQACKGRQRNKVVRKQRNDVQENNNNSSSGAGNVTNSKTVILVESPAISAANPPLTVPIDGPITPPIDGPITPPMITHPMAEASADIAASSGGASVITQEGDKLWTIFLHASMLLIIAVF